MEVHLDTGGGMKKEYGGGYREVRASGQSREAVHVVERERGGLGERVEDQADGVEATTTTMMLLKGTVVSIMNPAELSSSSAHPSSAGLRCIAPRRGGPFLFTDLRASDAVSLARRYGASTRLSTPDVSPSVLRNTARMGDFSRDSGRNLHTWNSLTRSRVRLPGAHIEAGSATRAASRLEREHSAIRTPGDRPIELPELQRVFITRKFDAPWCAHPSNPAWTPPRHQRRKGQENMHLAGGCVSALGMASSVS